MEEPSTLQGRKKCPKVSSKNPKRSCWFLATCWIIPLASLSLLGQTFSEILLFLFLCVSFYFFLFFSLSLFISNAGGRPLREKISKIDDIKRRRPRHSAPFFTNQCASPSVQFASFRLLLFFFSLFYRRFINFITTLLGFHCLDSIWSTARQFYSFQFDLVTSMFNFKSFAFNWSWSSLPCDYLTIGELIDKWCLRMAVNICKLARMRFFSVWISE